MQAYAVYAMRLAEPGFQLFRCAMGQGVEHLPVDETLTPGTYRIVSGLTGTVLQVSEHDHTKIVSWELLEKRKSQQWYLQHSGGGYRLKNREYRDLYLSVASTDTHALVTASKCPSTWVFLKIGDRHGIKLAESDKLIDLHFGRRTNGTEVHIWPSDGSAKQTWKLIRIGDEFMDNIDRISMLDEELMRLKVEVVRKDQQIVQQEDIIRQLDKGSMRLKDEVARKDQRIAQQEDIIRQLDKGSMRLKDEVARKDERIAQQEDIIRQLRADIKARELRSKFEILVVIICLFGIVYVVFVVFD